jgi:hypothetical protein
MKRTGSATVREMSGFAPSESRHWYTLSHDVPSEERTAHAEGHLNPAGSRLAADGGRPTICRSGMHPKPLSPRPLRARVYNAGIRDGDPIGCWTIRTLLGLYVFGWNLRATPRVRVAKETDLRVALKSDKNSWSTPSQTHPYSRFCGSFLWAKATSTIA